jgi:short-subunit dehydrogenase
MERFGRIDTWINNAGISVYGRCEAVPLEDQHRVMQTNFWGAVYGSLEAVKRMKTRGGGALINIGTVVSDRTMPLQGIYCASKHALKAYTDALRLELDGEDAPISVTLIRPSSVDTMFTKHAKNYMDEEPVLLPPVYSPEVVAETVLFAAEHPRRDVYVGGRARLMSVGSVATPRLLDNLVRAFISKQQQAPNPGDTGRRDALYKPDNSRELRERGGARDVKEHSPITTAGLYTKPLAAVLLGGGALLAALRLARRPRR